MCALVVKHYFLLLSPLSCQSPLLVYECYLNRHSIVMDFKDLKHALCSKGLKITDTIFLLSWGMKDVEGSGCLLFKVW